jgi:uncharacterized protein YcbK (DUF882 family)
MSSCLHCDGKLFKESGFRPKCVVSMGTSLLDAEQRRNISAKVKKAMVATTIVASLALGDMVMLGSPLVAGGENRSIQLYHIHTGESLTVTYMQNGRYVPSAMKQINYLLRDWRKSQVITIDPRSIDLVWELHEDLGSHRPIHIVCGYRSPKTNAFLKRIGRNVARHSQHMGGKAIDFYFPDVPTIKIRNSALVRRVGGVGYYRSAGGPTGFLHVDSGHVRHWGPAISNSQMAQIFRDGAKTVGRRMRLNSGNSGTVAPDEGNSGGGLIATLFGKKKPAAVAAEQPQVAAAEIVPPPAETDYTGNEDDMADLSADAAVAPQVKPKAKPPTPVVEASVAELVPDAAPVKDPLVSKAQAAKLDALAADAAIPPEPQMADNGAAEPQVRHGYPIPRPRLRPPEILLMAAANIKADQKFIRISAASAEPPDQSGSNKPSQVADTLGTVMEAESLTAEPAVQEPKTIKKTKSNFAAELRSGTTNDAPVIKPLIASAGGSDINWWPQLLLSGDAAIRRDGAPALIGSNDESSLPKAAILGDEGISSGTQTSAEGKGDLLTVNREGKGNLDAGDVLKPQKVGQLLTEQ